MKAVRAKGVVLEDGTVTLTPEEPLAPGMFVGWLVVDRDGDEAERTAPAEVDSSVLDRLRGCLRLGGDALVDTEALCDGG